MVAESAELRVTPMLLVCQPTFGLGITCRSLAGFRRPPVPATCYILHACLLYKFTMCMVIVQMLSNNMQQQQ